MFISKNYIYVLFIFKNYIYIYACVCVLNMCIYTYDTHTGTNLPPEESDLAIQLSKERCSWQDADGSCPPWGRRDINGKSAKKPVAKWNTTGIPMNWMQLTCKNLKN